MILTGGDMREAGIDVPLLVGGAALSEKFTKTRIGPAYAAPTLYAKDAMTGLRLMNDLMDPASREATRASHIFTAPAVETAPAAPPVPVSEARSSKVRLNIPIPAAPYLDRRIRAVPDLAELWSYVNPAMLYGHHLGFKGQGKFEDLLAQRDPKALKLHRDVEEVKDWAASFLSVKALWQFFPAVREGNAIHLFSPAGDSPLHTFRFGRQPRPDGLCLSDYVLDGEEGQRDHIALFVVTAGSGIRQKSEEAKQAGEFFKAHALQALAIETAEGCAEWLHRRIREDWGFPDPPSMTMHDRFTSRYRGNRYSFGYPACPNLDDQRPLFDLLHPEDIGVHLTEEMMMDPEASVSALVFHHPDCAYFTAASPEVSEPAFA